MKKIFLLTAMLLVCRFSIFAQFNAGLKAGLNYAMLTAREGQFDYEGGIGYQLGLWGRFGKNIYFQPEIYYSNKNTNITFNQVKVTNNPKGKIVFNTIDVPLLIGKQIGIDKLNFHFVVGPAIQFNLYQNNVISTQITNASFYNYKSIIANLQAGGGIDLGNLSIDLRYETGLQDINKNKGQHNNLIHLSVGYKFY